MTTKSLHLAYRRAQLSDTNLHFIHSATQFSSLDHFIPPSNLSQYAFFSNIISSRLPLKDTTTTTARLEGLPTPKSFKFSPARLHQDQKFFQSDSSPSLKDRHRSKYFLTILMSDTIQPSLKPATQPRKPGPLRRGRIQKRGLGLTRMDKDGDLDMDAALTAKTARGGGRRGNATASQPRGGRTSGAGHQLRDSRQSRNNLNHDAIQRSVLRSMGRATGDKLTQGSKHNTRITTHDRKSLLRERDSSAREGSAQVIIKGFKESKAAANPDGGIKDLLAFLVRKTSPSEGDTRDMVRINKVCSNLCFHAQRCHRNFDLWSALVSSQALRTTTNISKLCQYHLG